MQELITEPLTLADFIETTDDVLRFVAQTAAGRFEFEIERGQFPETEAELAALASDVAAALAVDAIDKIEFVDVSGTAS